MFRALSPVGSRVILFSEAVAAVTHSDDPVRPVYWLLKPSNCCGLVSAVNPVTNKLKSGSVGSPPEKQFSLKSVKTLNHPGRFSRGGVVATGLPFTC